MMLDIKLNLNQGTIERLKEAPGRMRASLFPAMEKCMILAERTTKQEYLSGKALRRRTGRLRTSITHGVTQTGRTISGKIGTNVIYGRFWELGFKGEMKVKAHKRTITQVFGKPVAPKKIDIKAFTRNVDIKARPFLRPGMEDNVDKFRDILKSAIIKAVG